jgi:excinuclease UvrABC nuclease subunit
MHYVYRYLGKKNEVLYVGITNNIGYRIKQHETDKLQEIKKPKIEYFAVKYRCDAELLETYLISHFHPRYNVAKTKKGSVSFLNGVEFPWIAFKKGRREKPPLFSIGGKDSEDEKEIEEAAKYELRPSKRKFSSNPKTAGEYADLLQATIMTAYEHRDYAIVVVDELSKHKHKNVAGLEEAMELYSELAYAANEYIKAYNSYDIFDGFFGTGLSLKGVQYVEALNKINKFKSQKKEVAN